jgi:hypothetical protein
MHRQTRSIISINLPPHIRRLYERGPPRLIDQRTPTAIQPNTHVPLMPLHGPQRLLRRSLCPNQSPLPTLAMSLQKRPLRLYVRARLRAIRCVRVCTHSAVFVFVSRLSRYQRGDDPCVWRQVVILLGHKRRCNGTAFGVGQEARLDGGESLGICAMNSSICNSFWVSGDSFGGKQVYISDQSRLKALIGMMCLAYRPELYWVRRPASWPLRAHESR